MLHVSIRWCYKGISQVHQRWWHVLHPKSAEGMYPRLSKRDWYPSKSNHTPESRWHPGSIRVRNLNLLINSNIFLLYLSPLLQNFPHRLILRFLDLFLQNILRISIQSTSEFPTILIALVEVSVIVDIGGTEETLCVTAGTPHFVATTLLKERLFAIIAFAQ